MQDIALDIAERDLAIKRVASSIKLDQATWNEDLTHNVFMDVEVKNDDILKLNNGDECFFHVHAVYHPRQAYFNIRFIAPIGTRQYIANACLMDEWHYIPLYACQLPVIDIVGDFIIQIKNGIAIIASDRKTELIVANSEDQEGQLLALCGKGNHFRYPLVGVGLHDYLKSVLVHSDMGQKILNQFEIDDKNVDSASFDAISGKIDVSFTSTADKPELDLENIAKLDIEPLMQPIPDRTEQLYYMVDGDEKQLIDTDESWLMCYK